ncbi:MAG: hypothetical protein JRN43_01995 [Nitrososphaerota archaeon]|nr:hypothetical protein [Nitrososphaerota archaeon]MDG7019067.1 hypothetical protein [Nitrososphaerota archaeon]
MRLPSGERPPSLVAKEVSAASAALIAFLLAAALLLGASSPASSAQGTSYTCYEGECNATLLGTYIISSSYYFSIQGTITFSATLVPGEPDATTATMSETVTLVGGSPGGTGVVCGGDSFNDQIQLNLTLSLETSLAYQSGSGSISGSAVAGSGYPSAVSSPMYSYLTGCPQGEVSTPYYSVLGGGTWQLTGGLYSGQLSFYANSPPFVSPNSVASYDSNYLTFSGGGFLAVPGPCDTFTVAGLKGATVSVSSGGATKPATVGATMEPGDTITTGDASYATISTQGCGSYIQMGPDSALAFQGIGSGNLSVWSLFSGILHGLFYTPVDVGTPAAVVTVRGTEFAISVSPGNATDVIAIQDAVSVQDTAGGANVTLSTGQQVEVNGTSGPMSQAALQAAVTAFTPSSSNEWWSSAPMPSAASSTSTTSSSAGSQTSHATPPSSTAGPETQTTSRGSAAPNGVPEFTYSTLALAALTGLVAVSYLFARRLAPLGERGGTH